MIKVNRAWSTLYHSILALGCQHDGGGSFEPGIGQAWRLFSISLSLYPELLAQPDSITAVNALTAMAIYSSGISYLSIEHLIISEAARRVQRLARTNPAGSLGNPIHRTFWVLYSMEKVSSFYLGRSSVCCDTLNFQEIPRLIPAAICGPRYFMSYTLRFRRFIRRIRLVSCLCTTCTSSISDSDITFFRRSHGKL